MTKVNEEIKLQNQTLANIPIILWRRFKSRCVDKGITLPQGFIEAANDWLEKD
jgi:hypothetical protein